MRQYTVPDDDGALVTGDLAEARELLARADFFARAFASGERELEQLHRRSTEKLRAEAASWSDLPDWVAELAPGARLIRTAEWGPITERRLLLPSGLEVEVDIGSRSWAETAPVDPGTRRVVCDGFRPLHDPLGLLAALAAAC